MARIAGINIPLNKHVVIALTSIFGIGNTRAKQICEAAGVAPATQVKDLAEPEVAKLRTAVATFTVEGDLASRDVDEHQASDGSRFLPRYSSSDVVCRYAANALVRMRVPARARVVQSSDRI